MGRRDSSCRFSADRDAGRTKHAPTPHGGGGGIWGRRILSTVGTNDRKVQMVAVAVAVVVVVVMVAVLVI